MPFTLSHSAAVLPLHRYCNGRLDFFALILGSFTPDFAYYWGDFGLAAHAHGILGSFVVCLPLGMIAYYVVKFFSLQIARISIHPFDRFFISIAKSDSRIRTVALSILIGSWTHNFWDGFTHSRGWFVLRISELQTAVFTIGHHQVHLYNLLQHASTVLGLLLVTWFMFGKKENRPRLAELDTRKVFAWLAILSFAFAGFLYQYHAVIPDYLSSAEQFRRGIFATVVSSIRNVVICLSMVVACLWINDYGNSKARCD